MFRSSNHYKRKPEYVYGQDNNQQSKQNKLKLYKLTLAVGLPENINRDESPQLTEIKRQNYYYLNKMRGSSYAIAQKHSGTEIVGEGAAAAPFLVLGLSN